MVWIIILAIIGIVLFYFLRDRDKMLEHKVDKHGGMKQKYCLLLEWLTIDPNSKITKITRDNVQVSYVLQTTATYWNITEHFRGVEIEWDSRLGMMGNHKLKWNFDSSTSQEQMIKKIGMELAQYSDKIM